MLRTTLIKFIDSPRFVTMCLILGILLRIAWLILIDSKPQSDAHWYYIKGLSIASGEGYTVEGIPTAYYPAGYPMFLGIIFFFFGNNLVAAKIANLLLSAGIIYLSYLVCKTLFKSERAARITILIMALYPNYIAYTSILATEILFTFLLFLGFYLLLISEDRFWLLLLTGLVWGFMCFVKPQGMFIPLLFLLTSLFQQKGAILKKLKPVVIVYIFMLAVLAPWLIRNYYVFNGAITISTNDGINLLIGNNPYANSVYHLTQEVMAYAWDQSNEYTADSMLNKITYSPYWTRYGFKDEYTASIKFRNKAIKYVLENPGSTLKILPKKLWMNYRRGYEGVGWAAAEITLEPWKKKFVSLFMVITNGFYYIVMFLFFCYCFTLLYKKYIKKQNIYLPLIGFFLIGYFTLLALIFFADYRFNFPLIPVFAMMGASLAACFLHGKEENSVIKEPGNFVKVI